jgi:hypothetical protein
VVLRDTPVYDAAATARHLQTLIAPFDRTFKSPPNAKCARGDDAGSTNTLELLVVRMSESTSWRYALIAVNL